MTTYRCPSGCEFDHALICGGDLPWVRRRPDEDPSTLPNVWFKMDVQTGEYLRETLGYQPFELDDEDWKDMFDHADGGCVGEPVCPMCLEYVDVLTSE